MGAKGGKPLARSKGRAPWKREPLARSNRWGALEGGTFGVLQRGSEGWNREICWGPCKEGRNLLRAEMGEGALPS